MRKESCGEGSSMSDNKTSPTNVKRSPLKSRRKLPFSENITTPSELEACREEKSRESSSSRDSSSLTPRRHTPLSERQQIALLCRLSGTTSSNDSSPVTTTSGEEGRRFLSLKRNERGETPLHLATIKGDYKKVHSLLRKGANVNAADFAGWTPLHEACNHGWYKIAKLLIEFDAEVNAVGLDKFTPLHDAVVNEHEDIVKLLLKYGANPFQENAHRRTPIDLARSEKISELLKASIDLPKNSTEEESTPDDRLGPSGAAETRQSESSPCQPPPAVCELTMRKNSPQNQTHKGADKPTSPRLTLRFQSIKSRDDKSSSSAKVNDNISSLQPKYPSYCVTMETKGDVYDLRREDATVSSTQGVSSTSESEAKCEAVTSTSEEEEAKKTEKDATSKKPEDTREAERPSSVEKMDTSEPVVPSKVNGGRLSVDSSNGKDCASDLEKEEGRRKRRRSNDSAQSNRSKGGHKSPSSKSSQQGSPKLKKRGSQSSSDTESNPSDAEVATGGEEPPNAFASSGPSAGPHSPKVPPLKIVIPSGSGSLEQLETRERSKVSSSKQALPYVVNTTSAETPDAGGGNESSASDKSETTSNKTPPATTDAGTPNKPKDDPHPPEEKFQRVTRSSQRMQAAMSSTPSGGGGGEGKSSDNSNVVSSSSQKGEGSGDSSNDEQGQMQIDVHPRKRKLRTRESGNENGSQNASSASSSNEDSQQQQQQLNSYQMYLNIRKQVDKRRKGMYIVQPKPPNGFKDYLLTRCSYVLEGNPASRLSVPMITPPQSLDGPIKELFIQQEKERYRLRLQHLIEREKLVLSVEQEILRVHGRSARAMANQTVPLSVCSVLRDEEIYNVLEDDKDKNVRSRYNGRLLLSWLQDVDDKWKKIKEAMLLRHHNEAESLHAVQKLDWEWKMKELGMCDMKTSPVIDDIVVPIVHVNDEFKLLSACQ